MCFLRPSYLLTVTVPTNTPPSCRSPRHYSCLDAVNSTGIGANEYSRVYAGVIDFSRCHNILTDFSYLAALYHHALLAVCSGPRLDPAMVYNELIACVMEVWWDELRRKATACGDAMVRAETLMAQDEVFFDSCGPFYFPLVKVDKIAGAWCRVPWRGADGKLTVATCNQFWVDVELKLTRGNGGRVVASVTLDKFDVREFAEGALYVECKFTLRASAHVTAAILLHEFTHIVMMAAGALYAYLQRKRALQPKQFFTGVRDGVYHHPLAFTIKLAEVVLGDLFTRTYALFCTGATLPLADAREAVRWALCPERMPTVGAARRAAQVRARITRFLENVRRVRAYWRREYAAWSAGVSLSDVVDSDECAFPSQMKRGTVDDYALLSALMASAKSSVVK